MPISESDKIDRYDALQGYQYSERLDYRNGVYPVGALINVRIYWPYDEHVSSRNSAYRSTSDWAYISICEPIRRWKKVHAPMPDTLMDQVSQGDRHVDSINVHLRRHFPLVSCCASRQSRRPNGQILHCTHPQQDFIRGPRCRFSGRTRNGISIHMRPFTRTVQNQHAKDIQWVLWYHGGLYSRLCNLIEDVHIIYPQLYTSRSIYPLRM